MMIICSDYVKDTLLDNLIVFGFFIVGVFLGLCLVLLIYHIYTKLKAKPPKLNKTYRLISESEDPVILEAKEALHELDTKTGIDTYILGVGDILAKYIRKIAEEYTGGKKLIALELPAKKGMDAYELLIDADFAIEDLLIFIQKILTVAENTVLTVTDKYRVLVDSFLIFIGLPANLREITVKDIVIYLNQKADKDEKKLEKAIDKKKVNDEKLRLKTERKAEKESKKEKKGLGLLSKYKDKNHVEKERLKQEKKALKEEKKRIKTEENCENKKNAFDVIKRNAFNKPINKVITEISEILIVGVLSETRRLYGRGYQFNLADDTTTEGGNNND